MNCLTSCFSDSWFIIDCFTFSRVLKDWCYNSRALIEGVTESSLTIARWSSSYLSLIFLWCFPLRLVSISLFIILTFPLVLALAADSSVIYAFSSSCSREVSVFTFTLVLYFLSKLLRLFRKVVSFGCARPQFADIWSLLLYYGDEASSSQWLICGASDIFNSDWSGLSSSLKDSTFSIWFVQSTTLSLLGMHY